MRAAQRHIDTERTIRGVTGDLEHEHSGGIDFIRIDSSSGGRDRARHHDSLRYQKLYRIFLTWRFFLFHGKFHHLYRKFFRRRTMQHFFRPRHVRWYEWRFLAPPPSSRLHRAILSARRFFSTTFCWYPLNASCLRNCIPDEIRQVLPG